MRHGVGYDSLAACSFRKLSATGEPLLVSQREPEVYLIADGPTMTAVGMILAPAATEVEAAFPDGRREQIPLRQLAPSAARKIDRTRFRYATFGVKGEWCPEMLTSKNAAGEVLWQGDSWNCPIEILGATRAVEGRSVPEY